MKATAGTTPTHNPSDETHWASGLRENLTSRSYGEGLETDRATTQAPRQSLTRQTTFEESHAHLGFETQRQGADQAIERTTPCLLGLYSLVTLLAHALYPKGDLPVHATAWYATSQATFADALVAVRRHLWGANSYSTSAHTPDLVEIPQVQLDRLLYAVCYTH